MSWREKVSKMVVATVLKLKLDKEEEFGPLEKEYERLEQVGAAPGSPWDQHDAMVRLGLCKAAEKHKEENRYCNLFPYDSNRVVLTGKLEDDYINASWVRLEGVKDPLILAMGPLHPDSYNSSKQTDFGEWEYFNKQKC